MEKEYDTVDSVEALTSALQKIRKAQEEYAKFSQEQVDKIFKAAALSV